MAELTQGGKRVRSLATRHNGVLFRSALEAKWARVFDLLCLKWEYEPEAVLIDTGQTYLPDFRLPDSGQFVEVKASGMVSRQDIRKMIGLMVVYGSLRLDVARPRLPLLLCLSDGTIRGLALNPGDDWKLAGLYPLVVCVQCVECRCSWLSPLAEDTRISKLSLDQMNGSPIPMGTTDPCPHGHTSPVRMKGEWNKKFFGQDHG